MRKRRVDDGRRPVRPTPSRHDGHAMADRRYNPVMSRYQISRLAALGSAWALAGCRTSAKEARKLVFFPAPPAAPRVQFLTWASGAEELQVEKSAFAAFVLGDEPTTNL